MNPAVSQSVATRKSSFVQRAFPVPRLLSLSNISVDVTDGELRYFEVARTGSGIRPKAYGTLAFPHVHMGGREEKNDKAAEEAAGVLKNFAKSKGISTARVVVHEGDAYVFKISVPTTVVSELRAAVESVLEENVPIPPSEALFEYEIVSVDTVRNETTLAVSVLPEKVVLEYLRLFEEGSVFPVSFETESRAIARALIPKGDRGVHAVLSIKSHHSVVFIVENGTVTFSSSIEVGSSDLGRAVEKTFALPPADAANLVAGKPAAKEPEETELFESMLPVFATVRDELSKVIVYYRTEMRKGGLEAVGDISDIILSGSAARIPGLTRYISLSTKIPARIGSVWTNVLSPDKDLPDLDERTSLDFGSLVGAHL